MTDGSRAAAGLGRAAVLAGTALAAACNGDDDAALAALASVSAELGAFGVTAALYVWADETIAAEQGCHPAAGVIVRPVFITDPLTGARQTDAGEVKDPVTRWCGQFIAARGALDHPACKALLAVIPGDELAEYVTRLLFTCVSRISAQNGGGPA